MNLQNQLARHFKDVHFGGNWTAVNLKDTLGDVSWQQAIAKVHSFNTIATLVFHINYYVDVVTKVLNGGPLEGSDKISFAHPPVESPEDWERQLNKVWTDAENLAGAIERLPEAKLWEDFSEKKYGSYYRNIQGVTEHTHYHLGQIVLIKKLLQ